MWGRQSAAMASGSAAKRALFAASLDFIFGDFSSDFYDSYQFIRVYTQSWFGAVHKAMGV
jgi:hypothetical protein